MRILWICDQRGWAYETIVDHVRAMLPQHEHLKYFYCETADPDRTLLNIVADRSDVVVSMYLQYQEALLPHLKSRVVTMLTGFRPFERGVNSA